ncbi:MAG: hypothetical protein AVDCRST_MAG64-4029 [uncultured Phycisphaerae bacterium]|uniref:Uncharacterized protein n=1 Tax=uncultured Phycisphaerae bacterium TaxID=904963 RepID=A0A6J4QK06_9BACT|nr:MAG: hypothetical protein AVDCRST_MAG64-4029 [uncultured Phycisphaerae bacterium]
MPLAEQLGDLGHRGLGLVGRRGRDRDVADVREPDRHRVVRLLDGRLFRVELGRAGRVGVVQRVRGVGGAAGGPGRRGRAARAAGRDAVLDRRPGDQDGLVLVAAEHVGALGGEDADHPQGDVLEPDLAADRALPAEQLADERLADQADLGAAQHVPVGEHLALLDRPLADVEVRRGGADDVVGRVVVPAGDQLAVGVDDRGDGPDGRAPLEDRVGVLGGHGDPAAGPVRHPAAERAARVHGQVVRPEGGDRLLHLVLDAVADLHHRDHGRDPDDDPERRQHRPHHVAAERPDGGSDGSVNSHDGTSGGRKIADFRLRISDCRSQTVISAPKGRHTGSPGRKPWVHIRATHEP